MDRRARMGELTGMGGGGTSWQGASDVAQVVSHMALPFTPLTAMATLAVPFGKMVYSMLGFGRESLHDQLLPGKAAKVELQLLRVAFVQALISLFKPLVRASRDTTAIRLWNQLSPLVNQYPVVLDSQYAFGLPAPACATAAGGFCAAKMVQVSHAFWTILPALGRRLAAVGQVDGPKVAQVLVQAKQAAITLGTAWLKNPQSQNGTWDWFVSTPEFATRRAALVAAANQALRTAAAQLEGAVYAAQQNQRPFQIPAAQQDAIVAQQKRITEAKAAAAKAEDKVLHPPALPYDTAPDFTGEWTRTASLAGKREQRGRLMAAARKAKAMVVVETNRLMQVRAAAERVSLSRRGKKKHHQTLRLVEER